MSKDWRTPPSVLLGIENDPYKAWCINEIVHTFGRYCENAMIEAQNAVKDSKHHAQARKAALDRILNSKPTPSKDKSSKPATSKRARPPRGQFRDPASMFH
jgi:hypothetical protein